MYRQAAAVIALAGSAAVARTRQVPPGEERVFRALNDAPDEIHPPIWAIMQSGSLAAVFVAAAGVDLRVGRDQAISTAVVGTAVWGGVKLVKPAIGRGRPEHHLDRVSVRGGTQSGLGFPSGHAAVATTLALTAISAGAPRRVALAVAAATGAARVYVGAHLPLDVVGGLAIGTLAADLARRVTGP